MTGDELRSKYIKFFAAKDHLVIPSAPLVPENDPTTLFTSSGMQPLIPYLLGEPHPSGKKRLVNSQKSFRSQDIDEVGDNRHTTFFEMLGNWSLGDYFKSDQLSWVWEFLTEEVGLPKEKLHVTLFEGDEQIPKDKESYDIWKGLGLADDHIHFYDAKKNWWSRSGTPDKMPTGEPGGPDSEVFYDFGAELLLHENSPFKDESCHVNCDCGRYLEIGNSVFMQYQKQKDGSLKELSQKNVDFGGGLERILAAAGQDPDVFKTDLFWPIVETVEKITSSSYNSNPEEIRIITDHLKAAVFLLNDGVLPSNKTQGYVLRRLLRRAVVKLDSLKKGSTKELVNLVEPIFTIYQDSYLEQSNKSKIKTEIETEINKFERTLNQGLKVLEKLGALDGKEAFNLFQTYGFPLELTLELANQKGQTIDINEFAAEFEKHQEQSRTASKGMFKGGLQDHSEQVTKYHTATHLLHQALRTVLGDHVHQTGSNITGDRLRFDFTHDKALSSEELNKIETLVNEQITKSLPVTKETLPLKEALKQGALAFFTDQYGKSVSVYSIGTFSKEVCGGPHVTNTAEIGPIRIYKQESVGLGRRRLYAQSA